VVYLRNSQNWWALIPAGILTFIGLAFIIAEAAVEYIVPIVLIAVGILIVVRQFTKKEQIEEPQPTSEEVT
jgi:uncharacterized membrane protein HdeD (DUF308 family)